MPPGAATRGSASTSQRENAHRRWFRRTPGSRRRASGPGRSLAAPWLQGSSLPASRWRRRGSIPGWRRAGLARHNLPSRASIDGLRLLLVGSALPRIHVDDTRVCRPAPCSRCATQILHLGQRSGQAAGRGTGMKREAGGPCLSAVFVDYDNIYLSLKRKSEEAAKRFAKEAGRWLREIESGSLITPTNASFGTTPRRIAMNRCYGNPVPRRHAHDNSTDMSSFPFVRHHFLRAGFEVIDCPPLTAQLKNSADIRMVMDIRDLLLHDTYFDEFIILSGDADFTPVLIRLRAHARRTVVFANDFTAAPYTAICDGEIREAALIELILAGGDGAEASREEAAAAAGKGKIDEARREIL